MLIWRINIWIMLWHWKSSQKTTRNWMCMDFIGIYVIFYRL